MKNTPKPLNSSTEIEEEITRLRVQLAGEETAVTNAAASGMRDDYDHAVHRRLLIQNELDFLGPQFNLAKERERKMADDRKAGEARERAQKRAAIEKTLIREAEQFDALCGQMLRMAKQIDGHRREAFALSDSPQRARQTLDYTSRAAVAAGLHEFLRIERTPKSRSLVDQFKSSYRREETAAAV